MTDGGGDRDFRHKLRMTGSLMLWALSVLLTFVAILGAALSIRTYLTRCSCP